jgi:hypothetical protein
VAYERSPKITSPHYHYRQLMMVLVDQMVRRQPSGKTAVLRSSESSSEPEWTLRGIGYVPASAGRNSHPPASAMRGAWTAVSDSLGMQTLLTSTHEVDDHAVGRRALLVSACAFFTTAATFIDEWMKINVSRPLILNYHLSRATFRTKPMMK